ncbi:MAG: class I SAM-dependent methyltransferase, partial [Candidatus Aenigmarchaeota archaeon]|nr:class I SAM-dependent methyltransferase [Candidatus Aenigmarchaeota archaeon]
MFTSEIYPEWMKEKQIQKYEDMKKFLPDICGLVLDVGCGPVWLKDFLIKNYSEIKYIGIDIRYKPHVLCSGDFLAFKTNSFDFVFCVDTLHLLKNRGEMKRVLKRGGYLIISEVKSLWNDNFLNNFKDLKIVKKSIIGKEEK